jgi:hypothetical protein
LGARHSRAAGCDTRAVVDRTVRLERIVSARAALEGRVKRTPILGSTTAASILAAAGGPTVGDGRVYLKSEHL